MTRNGHTITMQNYAVFWENFRTSIKELLFGTQLRIKLVLLSKFHV